MSPTPSAATTTRHCLTQTNCSPAAESAAAWMPPSSFAAQSLSPASRDFIAGLADCQTIQLADCTFHLTHAGPTGLFDRYRPDDRAERVAGGRVPEMSQPMWCSSATRIAPAFDKSATRSSSRRAAWARRVTACRTPPSPRGRTGRSRFIICITTITRRRTSWTRCRWTRVVVRRCSRCWNEGHVAWAYSVLPRNTENTGSRGNRDFDRAGKKDSRRDRAKRLPVLPVRQVHLRLSDGRAL